MWWIKNRSLNNIYNPNAPEFLVDFFDIDQKINTAHFISMDLEINIETTL